MLFRKIGVFLLLIALSIVSVSASAMPQQASQRMQIKNAGESNPDLIVDSINIIPNGDTGVQKEAIATIKNIGNTDAVGSVQIYYSFNRFILWKTVLSGYCSDSIHLAPNESTVISLQDVNGLPNFGIFVFTCRVNTGHRIVESNYDNNKIVKLTIALGDHFSIL